uniref:Pherophorin domain-containing protein n=1 Tax=Physcomitrium patens TaxID=3218 RepID=A0A2K1IX28_PHYPA|nr:hypothetical protein PHYPA_023641 [Physcomitrium patens]
MAFTSSSTRLVLSVFAVVVLLSGSAIAFDNFDGRPRPSGMKDKPSSTYGRKPEATYENKVADCTWYGWENANYFPNVTSLCSRQLWAALSLAADLPAFTYFVPESGDYYDPTYNEYFCTIGCFDLSRAGNPASSPVQEPTPSPPTDSGPPPAASPPPSPVVTPPPVSSSPPTSSPPTSSPTAPSTPGTPPPGIAPPPPATLFRPPPPPNALAPPVPSTAPGVPNPSNPVATGPAAQTASGSMLAPGYGSMLLFVALHFVYTLLQKH